MSEWMDGFNKRERWLTLSGRLQGIIEAHRIMKESGPDEDAYDRQLWELAAQAVKEAEDAGH
ncbi:MAG TPA: hypothetical protein VIG24_18995 [Acidimicrobiia bacterium]